MTRTPTSRGTALLAGLVVALAVIAVDLGPRSLGSAAARSSSGTGLFDEETPTVAKLDPDLLEALRSAAADAALDNVALRVNSGWRSAADQNRLLRDAVARHGSEDAAARWVATPETSPHVSGDAADIGPPEAARWLSEHGRRYGLCQIYRNEPWHFELRAQAVTQGCPPLYANPTQDPRMRR